jgi:hypothetical protein
LNFAIKGSRAAVALNYENNSRPAQSTHLMSVLQCQLLYRSISPHLQQLYTGFLMLHRSGYIRVSQQLRATPFEYSSDVPHLKGAGHAHLDAILDGKVRVHFDTHDASEVATGELEKCDFYFKRSYSAAVVDALPVSQREKMFPLGLNYRVLPDVVDPFALRRSIHVHGFSTAALSGIKQAVETGNYLGYHPRLRDMEAPPDPTTPARVLFLAAAYDPHDDPSRSADKIADRIHINAARARVIAQLRNALGERFVGGFNDSAFTRKHYPELVVSAAMTSQERFLELLKSVPICVATTGLHGSIGWKLAEYVAFAKAPLSEKLNSCVPGPFAPERNYLEFTTAEECLRGAVRLLDNPHLRFELMRNNARYYQTHLRPDVLVKNALMIALEHRPQRSQGFAISPAQSA